MHNSGDGASPCWVPCLYKPTPLSTGKEKEKTPPPGCRYARRGVEKTATRLPLLIAAHTINSCATTSLFLTFYIRMAAHFEGNILYS
jgi:hypothetical protein